jgi:hypothetical protein
VSWKTATLYWEKVWPLVGAVAAVIAWRACGKPFPASPDGLFGAAATVSSVFASFLGVSKALILTIKGTETFKILTERGYSQDLFAYLRDGIFSAVFFASLSILGFFVDHAAMIQGRNLYSIFSMVWVFAGALSLFSYIRISNILFKILKIA